MRLREVRNFHPKTFSEDRLLGLMKETLHARSLTTTVVVNMYASFPFSKLYLALTCPPHPMVSMFTANLNTCSGQLCSNRKCTGGACRITTMFDGTPVSIAVHERNGADTVHFKYIVDKYIEIDGRFEKGDQLPTVQESTFFGPDLQVREVRRHLSGDNKLSIQAFAHIDMRVGAVISKIPHENIPWDMDTKWRATYQCRQNKPSASSTALVRVKLKPKPTGQAGLKIIPEETGVAL